MTTNTNLRPHLVTSKTVEPGDLLVEGFGTLALSSREVSTVKRWFTNNRYTNAKVTFTNGDESIIYEGSCLHNELFYMQRDGHASRYPVQS